MTKRHYYALYDTFLGLNARELGHGFANRKDVVAFDSKQKRDEFLEGTKDLSARAVSRKVAESYAFRDDELWRDGSREEKAVRTRDDRYISIADTFLVPIGCGRFLKQWEKRDYADIQGYKKAA